MCAKCVQARIAQALIIYAGDTQCHPTVTLASEKHVIATETSNRNGGMKCPRFAVRVENVLGFHQDSFLRQQASSVFRLFVLEGGHKSHPAGGKQTTMRVVANQSS